MLQQTFFLLLNYRFLLASSPLSLSLSLSLLFSFFFNFRGGGGAPRERPRLNPRLQEPLLKKTVSLEIA